MPSLNTLIYTEETSKMDLDCSIYYLLCQSVFNFLRVSAALRLCVDPIRRAHVVFKHMSQEANLSLAPRQV